MKKKYYLTLDTETATLPFANELCKTAKEKQTIAIAKPLVYDIGWVITDRLGNIIKKANYLIQETFFVPNIFNTAYYKNKRPIYMELLKNGEIQKGDWNNVIDILIQDLEQCDLVTAYNACFDFKKAIPFTERYINALYSIDYNKWESNQRRRCIEILNGYDESENPEYLEPYFELRYKKYPIADLWGVACDRLINIDKYRNYCLENKLLTNSVVYFKSSAETSFQYLMNDYDFIENHTALSDAEIEAQILTKALKKGKIEPQIKAFPFRELGTTYNYVLDKKPKYIDTVIELLEKYIEDNDGENRTTSYWIRICNILETLKTEGGY
jgi:hypothetical protein